MAVMLNACRKKLGPSRWKKILYQRQLFQDNYTDPTFLSELKRNVHLRQYSWTEAALPLCSVTLEICCTVLFVTSFVFLDQSYISPYQLAWCSMIFVVLFFVLHMFSSLTETLERNEISMLDMAENGIVLLVCGYIFSPVLKTLSETISTDTIYAMVAFMLLIHVACQDYFPSSKISYSCLSLNSALFAAVCLASRLSTVQHTFSLILFAFQIFIFTPCFRFAIQEHAAALVFFTGLFAIVVCGILIHLRSVYAVLFILACIFINLFCPKLFVQYQVYKQNIYGPWDEAVIKEEKVT